MAKRTSAAKKSSRPKPKKRAKVKATRATKKTKKTKVTKAKAKATRAKAPKPTELSLLRRVYTNWLMIEEFEPPSPMQVSLELRGTTLVVERQPIAHQPSTDPDEEEDEEDDEPAEAERTETVHATPEAARAAFDAEVARLVPRIAVDAPDGEPADLAWVGPGWNLVWDEDSEQWIRHDECAVEARAEDGAPELGGSEADADVLADWRLTQSDPHVRALGELAHLRDLSDPATRARADALVAAHADAWLSGLLPVGRIGFRRAFVDTVVLSPVAGEDDFFVGAALASARELAAFLALPIASRLRRLVLGPVGEVWISGNPYVDNQSLLQAVIERAPSSLRDLELVEGHLNLAPLWRFTQLERLAVHGFVSELGDVASPNLRELSFFGGYGHAFLPNLTRASCPQLASLTVRTDIALHFREVIVAFLAASFPALRRFEFVPKMSVADTVGLVAASPLLPQLTELVLGGSEVTRADVDALVAAAPRFAHLRRLVVRNAPDLAPLGRALPTVELSA